MRTCLYSDTPSITLFVGHFVAGGKLGLILWLELESTGADPLEVAMVRHEIVQRGADGSNTGP